MAPYIGSAELEELEASVTAGERMATADMGTERAARHRAAKGIREASTLLKASISSAGATAIDGVAYQVLLVSLGGAYGTAAFAGAVLGALTNFTANRWWAFGATRKAVRAQAVEYALASLATYAALQTCLFVLVELAHVDGHLAWIPAKGVAWLFVSYPVQRFLVFADRKKVLASVPGAAHDGDLFGEGMDVEPEVQRVR